MKFPKHWRRWLAGCLILAPLILIFLVRHAIDEITRPPRRALQAYHQAILDDPARHAIRIERFTASDGTPVLICTADGPPKQKSRGEILRNQLAADGRVLAKPGEISGTWVLIHGRRGRKEDLLPMAERFCAVGFRCLIPDLPAHGDHPGNLATYGIREAGIPSLVLSEAAAKFQFPNAPAALLGMSMGGSVAIHAAARPDSPWSALVILQSFDRLSPVIQAQCDARLGATCGPLLFRPLASGFHSRTGTAIHDIHPAEQLSRCRIPTLIVHGTDDRTIPLSAGKRLFNQIDPSNPKRWIEVPTATHETLLITPHPVYAALASWFLDHLDPPPDPAPNPNP